MLNTYANLGLLKKRQLMPFEQGLRIHLLLKFFAEKYLKIASKFFTQCHVLHPFRLPFKSVQLQVKSLLSVFETLRVISNISVVNYSRIAQA